MESSVRLPSIEHSDLPEFDDSTESYELDEIADLRSDPSITEEMVEFVLACNRAKRDFHNGSFLPCASDCEFDIRAWDKLTPEQMAAEGL